MKPNKVRKGEKIVCKCSVPAGKFGEDVAAEEQIGPQHLEIETSVCEPDAVSLTWMCKTCKTVVVQSGNGGWTVKTARGMVR